VAFEHLNHFSMSLHSSILIVYPLSYYFSLHLITHSHAPTSIVVQHSACRNDEWISIFPEGLAFAASRVATAFAMASMASAEASSPSGLKVYFAGSIRGGRQDAELYGRLIEHIEKKDGTQVLTEHVGFKKVAEHESDMTEKEIYDRDMSWLRQSHCVVAEVTQPSLGVGYELGLAHTMEKPTLCLFRGKADGLSAMIRGCDFYTVKDVSSEDEAKAAIDEFLAGIKTA